MKGASCVDEFDVAGAVASQERWSDSTVAAAAQCACHQTLDLAWLVRHTEAASSFATPPYPTTSRTSRPTALRRHVLASCEAWRNPKTRARLAAAHSGTESSDEAKNRDRKGQKRARSRLPRVALSGTRGKRRQLLNLKAVIGTLRTEPPPAPPPAWAPRPRRHTGRPRRVRPGATLSLVGGRPWHPSQAVRHRRQAPGGCLKCPRALPPHL